MVKKRLTEDEEQRLSISFSLLRFVWSHWHLNAAWSALDPAVVQSLLWVQWLNLFEESLSFPCSRKEMCNVVVGAKFILSVKILIIIRSRIIGYGDLSEFIPRSSGFLPTPLSCQVVSGGAALVFFSLFFYII